MERDPNYLIILGTAKSGTTSLASWLGQRPDIALARGKEPRFFSDLGDRTWTGPGSETFSSTICRSEAAYMALFDEKPDAPWRLDASTDYLWCPRSPDLLQAFARRFRVKLICLTRDPVDRAISEYRHTLRMTPEAVLAESLALEDQRRTQGWQPLYWHIRRSLILDDLTRYHQIFGDDLMVIDFDDLRQPQQVLDRVAAFMDLPPMPFGQAPQRLNTTNLPRNGLVRRIFRSNRIKPLARALVPQSLRHKLYTWTHSTEVRPVSGAEKAQLRMALAGEIDRCLRSPLVPTAGWAHAKSGDDPQVSHRQDHVSK